MFRQKSDSSYKAMARIKNFLLDDCRQNKSSNSVKRMIDRHFSVDPKSFMLIGSFDFKPKNENSSTAFRQRSFFFFLSSWRFCSRFFSQRATRKSLHLHQFGLFDDFTRFLHFGFTDKSVERTKTGESRSTKHWTTRKPTESIENGRSKNDQRWEFSLCIIEVLIKLFSTELFFSSTCKN